jgi:hypothetical protein
VGSWYWRCTAGLARERWKQNWNKRTSPLFEVYVRCSLLVDFKEWTFSSCLVRTARQRMIKFHFLEQLKHHQVPVGATVTWWLLACFLSLFHVLALMFACCSAEQSVQILRKRSRHVSNLNEWKWSEGLLTKKWEWNEHFIGAHSKLPLLVCAFHIHFSLLPFHWNWNSSSSNRTSPHKKIEAKNKFIAQSQWHLITARPISREH